MGRSLLVLAAALALSAACKTPAEVPFHEDHYHFFVLGGAGPVNDNFVDNRTIGGFEVVSGEFRGGWSWEVGARYATGEGDGERWVVFDDAPPTIALVDVDRELEFFEFSIGARQTYMPDSAVQPYFGVGGFYQETNRREEFIEFVLPPPDPPEAFPVTDRDEFHGAGLYMRTGLLWNFLRDTFGRHSEAVLGLDLRGSLGTEYNAIELTLALGWGK